MGKNVVMSPKKTYKWLIKHMKDVKHCLLEMQIKITRHATYLLESIIKIQKISSGDALLVRMGNTYWVKQV